MVVGSASGSFAGAMVLYETALGIGIATELLLGLLGSVSWRAVPRRLRPHTHRARGDRGVPAADVPAERRSSLREPLAALRHSSLRTTSLTGLLYNWGFFTLLG